MRIVFLAFLLSAYASTEIVVIPDGIDYDTTPYISQGWYSTGDLTPGEEAIFWFVIPSNGPYKIKDDATLNLFGHEFADDSVNFNVRLRQGNDNFDDRDSELKKKTWGYYASSNLYTCDVQKGKKYYVQVENPISNTLNSSLSISMNVDNEDMCKSVDELGHFIGRIALFIFLGCVAVVVIPVVACTCCICAYQHRKRAAAQPAQPPAPGPHPYYNPVNQPAQGQHQQQVAVAPDAEAQIVYNVPPSGNPNSEAMNRPLIV